ncbi:hypothetical protein ACLB2K_016800 [Fragaria x ananassa]
MGRVLNSLQAEYEALIIGLEILLELRVCEVQVFGDSLFVDNQLVEKFKCLSSSIEPYLRKAFDLLDRFDDVHIEHIPCEFNFAANELAQIASSLRDSPNVAALDPIDEDWWLPFIAYLTNPHDATHSWKMRFLALNFVLRNSELRQRDENGNDFRCVYDNEAKRLMHEVHCGVCGSHQWLIRHHGYYWPTILKENRGPREVERADPPPPLDFATTIHSAPRHCASTSSPPTRGQPEREACN